MNPDAVSIPLPGAPELPFVNREEELSLLGRTFDLTIQGKGQVVFVTGEGGIGKTRLVYELAKHARSQGAMFAVGSSYEGEGLVPYAPWIETIRAIVAQSAPSMFGKTMGRTVAEVGRLVPELEERARELGIKGWLSGPGERLSIISSTDAERVRLFQAVTDFLTHISQQRPLVLFLDDVQWADPASLQLLHYFCRRIKTHRILVLGAYREAELPEEHPLSPLLLNLNRERILQKVALQRLTTTDVSLLISSQLGGEVVAPEFVKLVHSRTGGNPFFVEEVLRSLIEDKQAYRSSVGWTVREIGQVEIPSTVKALIKQRISRLDEETLQILSTAAVVGMDFQYEIMEKVTGADEDRLIQQLEKSIRSGLVKEVRSEREVTYVFADEQIRDYLHDELSIIRRRKIHVRITQAMEQLYQRDREQNLEELAYHSIQAGNAEKAAEYSLLAGDRAASLHAHAAAKKHYANLLELLDPGQLDERLEALTRLGDASYRLAESGQCSRYYNDALALARQLKQTKKIAQLCAKLGSALWLLGNDKQGALKIFREGVMALENEEDTHEEAEICQAIARLLVNTGDMDSGLEWCDKAIQLAKKLDDREVLAQSLITLSFGLRPNRATKADVFRYLEEAIRISLENGFDDAACRGYNNLGGQTVLLKFDYAKAKETYLKGLDYSRKAGYENYAGWMEAELARFAYYPLGEWDKAWEIAKQSLLIGSERGELPFIHGDALVALGMVALLRGNQGEAEDYLKRAYRITEESSISTVSYEACLALSKLHIERNELEKAEQYLAKGVEMGKQWGYAGPFEVLLELVRVYCIKNDLDKAREVYTKIKEAAEELDEKGAYAFEHWASGLIASTDKDWIRARDQFKASSELWSELKHPHNYAQTLLESGRAASRSGGAEEARRSIDEARGVFIRLGARLDLAKIES